VSGKDEEIEDRLQEDRGQQREWKSTPFYKMFKAMDRILGHRPATCPPVVVDTLSVAQDDDIDRQAGDVEASECNEGEGSPVSESSILTYSREDSPSATSSVCGYNSAASDFQTRSARTKRPKRDYPDKQCRSKGVDGRMKDMMETVMSGLEKMKEADALLLVALEEKRMKYEDSRLREERAYEERRIREDREFEDRRREKRQFQLQMMEIMVEFGNHSPTQYGPPLSYTSLLDNPESFGHSQQG
jgi:hypothetical protein